MAKTQFPNGIEQRPKLDRRQLLASATALSVAGIIPSLRVTEAPRAQALPSLPPTPEVQGPNLSTAMAGRMAEIARRNEIRQEAGLPLLPIPRELRRMKQQEEAEEFERFEAAHGRAIWDAILKPRREAEGNPNWRPRNSFEGLGYQKEVFNTLKKQFYAERAVA